MSDSLASKAVLGKRTRAQDDEKDPYETDSQDGDGRAEDGADGPDSDSDSNDDDGNSDEDNDNAGDDKNGLFVDENEDFEHYGDDLNDDGLDDANDPNAVYHEGKEPYPKHPAYDPDLPNIKAGLINIVEQVAKIVDNNPCNSTYVKEFQIQSRRIALHPEAISNAHRPTWRHWNWCKSSLINSIADVPDLAKALASGESCTAVATEYCGQLNGQLQNFAMEISYYDEETSKALIKEHVQSYNQNREVKADWDDDTRQLYKRRADTTIKVLHALFCDHEELCSLGAVEGYLNQAGGSLAKATPKLYKWYKELYTKTGLRERSVVVCESSTHKGFREATDALINATSSPTQPTLWPLVKFVRVGVRCSRVLEHVSLADLPGISDTNAFKVNAANDCLRQCDGLWIVAPIGRAANNTTVGNLFSKYEESFRENIAIICTRAEDDISPALASHYETEKQTSAAYDKAANKSRDIHVKLNQAKRTLQLRKSSKNTKEKSKQVKQHQREVKKLEKQKAKAENERLCGLVDARNRFVKQGLERELKGHLPPGRNPTVFCVSNAHYLSFKEVTEKATVFQLSAKQTGIPALRAYLLTLAAPGILQALEDYVKHHFLVFLKGVQLWVIRKNVEGASALLEVVKQPQLTLGTRFEQYLAEFREPVDARFCSHVSNRIPHFASEATSIWDDKVHKYHWGTRRAFIAHNGKHDTSMCPKESWNMQFWQEPKATLSKSWTPFKRAQEKPFSRQMRRIVVEMRAMEEISMEQPAVTNLEMDSFYQLLHGHIAGVERAFRDHQVEFNTQLGNIRLDTTLDNHTNFFVTAMQPVYDILKADSGTGYVKRQEKLMHDVLSRVNEKSPFRVALESTISAIYELAKMQSDALEAKVSDSLREIWGHFNGMIDPDEQDPAEQPLREELRIFVETADHTFNKLRENLTRITVKGKPKVKVEEVPAEDLDGGDEE
ncbi:hypothetical protein Slin15195_G033050 [Septoria linicola]|uniref:DUF7605 domain-containing protein n=1 Tax=Septoria linicola TaxID=215465 RepID=A0A9Q9AQ24_9PEZI|nr:hypothetical protein Slin14017_G032070 [Septoria linicola]USW49986.1 hypothetical protein Slin15195_G033050 [Septoria linicola]